MLLTYYGIAGAGMALISKESIIQLNIHNFNGVFLT